MADESEEFTYEDHSQLPDILPIFPLPNVVLTPNASLPLFIFEDRYSRWFRTASWVIVISRSHSCDKGGSRSRALHGPTRLPALGALCMPLGYPTIAWTLSFRAWDVFACLTFMMIEPICAPRELLRPTYPPGQNLTTPAETMKQRFLDLLDLKRVNAPEVRTSLRLLASPIDLVFFILARLPLDPYTKQEILQTPAGGRADHADYQYS